MMSIRVSTWTSADWLPTGRGSGGVFAYHVQQVRFGNMVDGPARGWAGRLWGHGRLPAFAEPATNGRAWPARAT